MKNIIYISICLFFISFAISLVFIKNNNYPFRCSGFTHYDLSDNDENKIDLFLAQELRLQSESEGYIIFNGRVKEDKKESNLSRKIVLDKGKKIDNDTYQYRIASIQKSPTDDTPQKSFEKLLNEFTSDPAAFQLDVIHLEGNIYLIGGSVSYPLTCTRY